MHAPRFLPHLSFFYMDFAASWLPTCFSSLMCTKNAQISDMSLMSFTQYLYTDLNFVLEKMCHSSWRKLWHIFTSKTIYTVVMHVGIHVKIRPCELYTFIRVLYMSQFHQIPNLLLIQSNDAIQDCQNTDQCLQLNHKIHLWLIKNLSRLHLVTCEFWKIIALQPFTWPQCFLLRKNLQPISQF